MDCLQEVIKVENLAVGYAKKSVLTDLDFVVGQGEMLGIIGPNGAGKSTLLKAMRALLPLNAGSVSVFGEPTTRLSERAFSHLVAYLQQHVDVSFGYTGKELVLAGRYPYLKWWQGEGAEDEVIARQCMEYTGVWDLADTPVQEVSGGQKQRILLAKVLAQKTPVLFLDEPTTGLDIVYQEEIFRFCQTLCRAGKTIVMVAHELNLAYKFCSRLLLIAQGGILADGSPETVLTSENLSAAYGVPVKVLKNSAGGGIDIEVVLGEEERRRYDELVAVICDSFGNECR